MCLISNTDILKTAQENDCIIFKRRIKCKKITK